MNTKPTGYVIYRGPSLLDGMPIVAIAITGSGNVKTGNMVQTYILPDNGVKPTLNLKSGADVSVCGDCKHRPLNGGACYVVVAQGPTVVFKTYVAGKYPVAVLDDGAFFPSNDYGEQAIGENRMVRLGTYGDPAAVPARIWYALIKYAKGHTGYTHQWRNTALSGAQREAMRALCMASADTPEERDLARSMGYRTFTVRLASDALADRESVCPASTEAGKKVTCAQCGMCNGAAPGRRGSIAIIAHGAVNKVNNYATMRA